MDEKTMLATGLRKTHVLLFSNTFPKYHPKKGERTEFVYLITKHRVFCGACSAIREDICSFRQCHLPKIHTCRGNYELWKQRVDEVNRGIAVISLRTHTLGAYVKGDVQKEFLELTKNDEVGVQKLDFLDGLDGPILIDGKEFEGIENICINDGLNYNYMIEWLKPYDLSKPLAIIHFTKFRY